MAEVTSSHLNQLYGIRMDLVHALGRPVVRV